jgi:hypothetical protein
MHTYQEEEESLIDFFPFLQPVGHSCIDQFSLIIQLESIARTIRLQIRISCIEPHGQICVLKACKQSARFFSLDSITTTTTKKTPQKGKNILTLLQFS